MRACLFSFVGLVAAVAPSTACLQDDLVQCADGRACPVGTLCDDANATCIDPRGLSVPAGDIDFASVGCGTSSVIAVPVRNFGISPVDFQVSSTIAGVTVSPTSGTIEPGASVELAVTADPDPASIPGVTAEGSLVISTPYELVERAVKLTTVGALVTADTAVDFGETGVSGVVQRAFSVRNLGNTPTDLSFSSLPGSFYAITELPLRLEANSERAVLMEFRPGGVIYSSASANATFAFTGVHCQAPPASVPLRARASGDPILASALGIDFHPAACGVDADAQTVTLTSQLPQATQLSVGLDGTGAAAFSVTAGTTLPPGPDGTLVLTVTRNAVPVDLQAIGHRDAMLTISTTTGQGAVTKAIPLSHDVTAPALSLQTSTVHFGGANVLPAILPESMGDESQEVAISNAGNATALVTVSPARVTLSDGSDLSVSPSTFFISPDSTAQVTVRLRRNSTQLSSFSKTFTFTAPGQCSSLTRLSVSGGSIIVDPAENEPAVP